MNIRVMEGCVKRDGDGYWDEKRTIGRDGRRRGGVTGKMGGECEFSGLESGTFGLCTGVLRGSMVWYGI